MSNLNYARIRNSQKKSDSNIEPKNFEFSAPLEINPTSPNSLPMAGETTPFPGTSVKIESSKLKNLFGENVHMDNLNYINDMLRSSLPDAVASRPQRKKKGKEKTDDIPVQGPVTSPEKAKMPIILPNDTGKPPINIVTVVENEDSSLLDLDKPTEGNKDSKENKLNVPKVDKLFCERSVSSALPAKETEIYAEGFQTEENESIKRSMSVADIRTTKAEQPKTSGFGKNHYYVATEEPDTQNKDLLDARATLDSGPSRSAKSDFAASLGQYIDYFQKSETAQYRTIKASQYFVNNVGNRGANGSQNHVNNIQTQPQVQAQAQVQAQHNQKLTQSTNVEMEKMKTQIRKLKEKVHDLQLSNELLYKERKGWKRKHQELLLRAETAEGDLTETFKKAKHYKEKLKHTEELLQREKLDNENNLLALKRVLANNISTVLEHRINHYMSSHRELSPKEKKSKNVWPDSRHLNSKGSTKEKEKKSASTHMHSGLNSANFGSGINFEETHHKMKHKRGPLHDKMSPLLSHKDASFSDDDDLKGIQEKFGDLSQVDDLCEDLDDKGKLVRRRKQLSQFSMRPSDLDTSSEPTEELLIQNYFSQPHNSQKVQQIQYLQNKLARLIDKEESTNPYANLFNTQPISHRNYESAKSHRIKGHTNSCFTHKSQPSNSWNTINPGRKVHEGTVPPTELHSQPSLHC